MTVKVTVNLPDESVDALRKIAQERDITLTEALRQAIESERFLEREVRQGSGRLLLEKPGGALSQVILPAKSIRQI